MKVTRYDPSASLIMVSAWLWGPRGKVKLEIGLADARISPVALERPLAGPDGVRLEAPGRAIVVEQGSGAVSRIFLGSGEIDILQDGLRDPTSLDVINGEAAWIAEGQLRHLFDNSAPALPFEVIKVSL